MKNEKIKPLQIGPVKPEETARTLEIHIGKQDQAAQSNQIEQKPVPLNPNNYNKKDMIAFLNTMIKGLETYVDEKSVNLMQVIKYAISEIGKCYQCKGTGDTPTDFKPSKDYKVVKNPKKSYFLVPCNLCRGTGKLLDVQCASCGKNANIMPDQRHFSYCQDCEHRLLKSGYLL